MMESEIDCESEMGTDIGAFLLLVVSCLFDWFVWVSQTQASATYSSRKLLNNNCDNEAGSISYFISVLIPSFCLPLSLCVQNGLNDFFFKKKYFHNVLIYLCIYLCLYSVLLSNIPIVSQCTVTGFFGQFFFSNLFRFQLVFHITFEI